MKTENLRFIVVVSSERSRQLESHRNRPEELRYLYLYTGADRSAVTAGVDSPAVEEKQPTDIIAH